jgi:hypothetical protein
MTKNKKVVKDVKKVDIKEKATLMKEIDIIFENKKVDSNNANIDNNQKKSNNIINKKVKKIDNAEDNDSVEDEDENDEDEGVLYKTNEYVVTHADLTPLTFFHKFVKYNVDLRTLIASSGLIFFPFI